MTWTRTLRTALFAAFAAPALLACGDDAEPGVLVVNWSHGSPITTTCASRGLATIEARLLKGKEEIVSASSVCGADKNKDKLNIPNVTPGSYRLEVEGFDAEGHGSYLGVVNSQKVASGTETESAVVQLAQKQARIVVDWAVPGGKCSSSSIAHVDIELFYDSGSSNRSIGKFERTPCDNTFKEDGIAIAGVLFEELIPNGSVSIQGIGYDAQRKIVATAITENFDLRPGDELTKVITFELCGEDC